MLIHKLRSGLFIFTVLALTNCASLPDEPDANTPWKNWQTPLPVTSSLQGKIWSYRDNGFIDPEQLTKELSTIDFVLLGETHDNADHHRLQAWVVSAIAAQGRRPAIVWEMFDTGQSDALARYLASQPDDADDLGNAIGWDKTGWPDWPLYQPIAEAALAAGLDMFAGDPPVTLVRAAGKDGYSILPEGQAQSLFVDTPLSDDLQSALERQIVTSHCNLIPANATGPMFRGQRLRDAYMARSMIKSGSTDGAILIAGTGHVRLDRAVPWYLHRHQKSRSIASLMFVGVAGEDDNPLGLIPNDPDGKPAADYAWFTPKVVRTDPCIALKKRFAK